MSSATEPRHPPRNADAKTFLVFSQTFIPDPAAVGQCMADAAREMARRGHRVVVYTANRGYDDPTQRYPAREVIDGMEIRRLPLSSFGKRSILTRVLGTFTFLCQCIVLALFTPRLAGIFFSTSPPLVGLAGALARVVRRVPVIYWAMDLNPDQLIAMGKIRPRGPVARVLETVNRIILRSATLVVVLDRFMAERLRQRARLKDRLIIIPPWPHEDHMELPARDENPFIHRHGLAGKFVVMYSGNHSFANPLTTLLQATLEFKDDPDIRFLFVGGGTAKREVEQFIATHHPANVLSLPYQPLETLGQSLSAADVHVVSMGDPMVGIIHPCKVYGAMAIGRPILYLGPAPSHVTDLLDRREFGVRVRHGDVAGAAAAIRRLRDAGAARRQQMGESARALLDETVRQSRVCGELCDAIERVLFSLSLRERAGVRVVPRPQRRA